MRGGNCGDRQHSVRGCSWHAILCPLYFPSKTPEECTSSLEHAKIGPTEAPPPLPSVDVSTLSMDAEAEAGSAATAEPDEAEPDERHWLLTTEGERFVDAEGRTVQLRGINLPCKLPQIPQAGQDLERPSRPLAMRTYLDGGPGGGGGGDGGAGEGGGETDKGGGHWDFFDGRSASFVGRPFPLEEADEHLLRLRSWGFNCLRFNVAWEAIEHAGPGQYDLEYIQYVRMVLERAAAHGLWVYIDPHQVAIALTLSLTVTRTLALIRTQP